MKGKRVVALFSTLCLCAGMLVTPFSALPTFGSDEPTVEVIEASAATNYDSLETTNGYYGFNQGARVGNIEQNENGDITMDLSFAFEVRNTSHFTFNRDKDTAVYEYTVVRDSEQGQIPVASIVMYSSIDAIIIGHKQIVSSSTTATGTALKDNAITLDPNQFEDNGIMGYFSYEEDAIYYTGKLSESNEYYDHVFWTDYKEGISRSDDRIPGYTMDYCIYYTNHKKPFYPKTEGVTFPTLYLNVSVNSIYASYFIVADVYFKKFTGYKTEGALWWKEEVPVYDSTLMNLPDIRTQSRSCKQVLEGISAAGRLEEEFPNEATRAIVNDILGNTETQEITVKYLKQIGSSPFARAISSTVKIETYNDRVYYDDVCDAVGEKTLSCMGATVDYFEKNSMNVYEAIYLSSIEMKSLTEDGYYAEYYIGLGQTFNEFIDDFNGDDIFDPGLFEFMLNDIHVAYPVTEPYTGDEIYGFWGCFVIPETLNMNTVWANFFQIDAATTGIGKTYEVVANMTVGEYWTALDNHDYNWGEKVFQVVANAFTNWFELEGKYVLYYAKSYVTSGGYNESGDTNIEDSNGAIIDSVNGALNGIVDAFKDMNLQQQNQTNETVRSILMIVGIMFGLMFVGGVVVFLIMNKHKKK